MKLPADSVYVADILNAAAEIAGHVNEMTREQFEEDRRILSASLYRFIVIGEAASRLSEAFKSAHKKIPWRRLAELKNDIIRHYNNIELDLVWDLAKNVLPAVVKSLQKQKKKRHVKTQAELAADIKRLLGNSVSPHVRNRHGRRSK